MVSSATPARVMRITSSTALRCTANSGAATSTRNSAATAWMMRCFIGVSLMDSGCDTRFAHATAEPARVSDSARETTAAVAASAPRSRTERPRKRASYRPEIAIGCADAKSFICGDDRPRRRHRERAVVAVRRQCEAHRRDAIAQPLGHVMADVLHATADRWYSAPVLNHYAVPLLDGDDVFMPFKYEASRGVADPHRPVLPLGKRAPRREWVGIRTLAAGATGRNRRCSRCWRMASSTFRPAERRCSRSKYRRPSAPHQSVRQQIDYQAMFMSGPPTPMATLFMVRSV